MATTTSAAPPASISTLLAANGSFGIGRRADRNDPIDQESDAIRITTTPVVEDPPSEPVSESAATPPKPTSTPARVSTCGRSRTSRRKSTSHSGTDATSSAARPLEMCCSATETRPLPPVSSSTPTRAAPRNSRRFMAKAPRPRRHSSPSASSGAATRNRIAPL